MVLVGECKWRMEIGVVARSKGEGEEGKGEGKEGG